LKNRIPVIKIKGIVREQYSRLIEYRQGAKVYEESEYENNLSGNFYNHGGTISADKHPVLPGNFPVDVESSG
jgi:hypothetical protein